MKNFFTILRKIIYFSLICLLIVTSLTFILINFKIINDISIFSVQSGSMEPTIKTGSIIVSKAQDIYTKEDIITFEAGENKETVITHRIFSINNDEITTKGDANNVPDGTKIKKDQIIGKTVFSIPYIGYPFIFAQTQLGFILLIIIPATLIVSSELRVVKEELQKFFKKKDEKAFT